MSEESPAPRPLDYALPPSGKFSVLAILSLSLGIVATPLDYACEIGLVFGLAACILGAIALARIKRLGQRGKGLALAGIILGGISLLVGITCGFWMMYGLRGV